MKWSSVLRSSEIGRRYRHPRRHLHSVLSRQQRPHIGYHPIIAAATALGGAQSVMNLADAVEAHRHGEAIALEEVAILRGESVPLVVIEKPIGIFRSPRGAPRDSVARRIRSRLTSGSPPRKARLTRSPGLASANRRRTEASATSHGMFRGVPPKLPPSA